MGGDLRARHYADRELRLGLLQLFPVDGAPATDARHHEQRDGRCFFAGTRHCRPVRYPCGRHDRPHGRPHGHDDRLGCRRTLAGRAFARRIGCRPLYCVCLPRGHHGRHSLRARVCGIDADIRCQRPPRDYHIDAVRGPVEHGVLATDPASHGPFRLARQLADPWRTEPAAVRAAASAISAGAGSGKGTRSHGGRWYEGFEIPAGSVAGAGILLSGRCLRGERIDILGDVRAHVADDAIEGIVRGDGRACRRARSGRCRSPAAYSS